MKTGLLFILVVGFFNSLSGVDSPLGNPVGLSTVPPSALRNSLVRSPNPIDMSGNLIITGNVGGGRHFRGTVPYNAISDFGGRLGTGTLDSFLRYSISPEHVAGGLTRFYSQTRTVTTIGPGQTGILRPPTTGVGRRFTDTGARPSLSEGQALSSQVLSLPRDMVSFSRFGLTHTTPRDLEQAILGQVGTSPQGTEFPGSVIQQDGLRRLPERLSERDALMEGVSEGYVPADDRKVKFEPEQLRQGLSKEALEVERQQELADLRRMLQTIRTQKGTAERQLLEARTAQDEFSWLRSSGSAEADKFQLRDPILRGRQIEERALGDFLEKDGETAVSLKLQQPMGVYGDGLAPRFRGEESVRAKAGASERLSREQGGGMGSEARGSIWDSGVYGQIEQRLKSFQKGADELYPRNLETYGADREPASEIQRVSYEQQVEAVVGSSESFASFLEEKFNLHLRAGERYLKNGMYYQAADAFTLASAYKPGSPLVYAGKGHALLAAGEYMSSALFLSRALETFPEYEEKLKSKGEEPRTGEFNVFRLLAAGFALIDRDKLEKRLVDIEQWQQKSDSAELQFLLGYIYYQMGRFERAKEAVKGAYDKMPESPAVATLRRAIDARSQEYDARASGGKRSLNVP